MDHREAHPRRHRAPREVPPPGRNRRCSACWGVACRARNNLEALKVLFPLRVIGYDIVPERLDGFAEYACTLGLEVENGAAASSRDRLRPRRHGQVRSAPAPRHHQGRWLDAGAFASLVNYDSYWDGAALQEVDKFTTDDVPLGRALPACGLLPKHPAHLCQSGRAGGGGRSPDERRPSGPGCDLGLALDDIATAPIVYRRAVDRGIGTWLPL